MKEPALDPDKPLAAAQQRVVQAGVDKAGRYAANLAKARAVKAAKRAQAIAEGTASPVTWRAQQAAKKAAREAHEAQVLAASRQKAHPELVLGLAAAGVATQKIAAALHVAPQTVQRAISEAPGGRERLARLREELKGIKLTRAHAVEGRLWDRLDKEVADGAAKDVDAVTRALLASEKIQAAAAGEAHASGGTTEPASAGDLTVLVQALLSAPSGGGG